MAKNAAQTVSAPAPVAELSFKMDKETKGTYRYAEQGIEPGGRGVIGSIYLNKSLFNGSAAPQEITVTVAAK